MTMCNSTVPSGSGLAASYVVKYSLAVRHCLSAPRCLPKRDENRHPCICSWRFYSQLPRAENNPSARQLLNGETKWDTFLHEILFGNTKERALAATIGACQNSGEARMRRADGKNPDRKAAYYDSLYGTFSECQDYRDRKLISGCQGLGVGERLTARRHEGIFEK